MQLEGKERITCDLPKEELQALNDYYSSMTSVEVGDRLFERTMWYCSAENGWTIRGAAAAELYGIATDIDERDSTGTTASSYERQKFRYVPGKKFVICRKSEGGAVSIFKAYECPFGAKQVL